MPKAPQPVASFDARLLELFRRAAEEPVRVVFPSARAAHRLRFRLHSLRQAMRREAHPMLALAEAVTIRITHSIDATVLIAGPADDDLASALDSIGLVVDSDSAAASEDLEPMDEFLSRLVHRKTKD